MEKQIIIAYLYVHLYFLEGHISFIFEIPTRDNMKKTNNLQLKEVFIKL